MPLMSSVIDMRTGNNLVDAAYIGSELCWSRAADLPPIPLEYLTLRWTRNGATTALSSRPSDATPENCTCSIYKCNANLTGEYSIPETDEVGIPLTRIRPQSFEACNNITSITIGSAVSRIDTDAFKHCKGIIKIVINSDSVFMNSNAFRFCDALEVVKFGSHTACESGNGNIYNFGNNPSLVSFNAGPLGDIVARPGLYGSSCLAYNTAITEIVFPPEFSPPDASLCGYYVNGCTELTTVKIYNPEMIMPTNMLGGAFLPKFTTVYGYEGSTAEAWANANSKIFIPL